MALLIFLVTYVYYSLAVATAAMEMLGGKETLAQCRTPEIMADAAYAILSRDSKSRTGEFLIDDDVLREVGVTDFDVYAHDPSKVQSNLFSTIPVFSKGI